MNRAQASDNMSSCRRILPTPALASHGCEPILGSTTGDGVDADGSGGYSTTQMARTRHAIGETTSSKPSPAPAIVGVKICGWEIISLHSTIGSEECMDGLTDQLEHVANKPNDDATGRVTRHKRRVCPPEITFTDAKISLVKLESHKLGVLADADGETGTELRFTARDALLEWAEAHQKLGMDHSCTLENRGVRVMKTADAKIWSTKAQNSNDDDDDDTKSIASEFYYDWTFSSPYAGTIVSDSSAPRDVACISECARRNNGNMWKPLPKSKIPFHMLQDTSQPILLYDDVHLYEDDLHDNGDVSLNIKVRVMPMCWYVLQRLFVRVDHVCVKCREVRYFCLFRDKGSRGVDGVELNTIYRDVSWREASWEELSRNYLPTDISAWREEAMTMPGMPPLAALLNKLPSVPLPDDIPEFSCYDAS